MVSLYGLGQSFFYELAFGIELGPMSIYSHGIRARRDPKFKSHCHLESKKYSMCSANEEELGPHMRGRVMRHNMIK